MGIPEIVLDVVIETLFDQDDSPGLKLLKTFDDFVIALSADSGLPQVDVQSRLIERMMLSPSYARIESNVIRLDDYLHLASVN